jgi:uncharacterized membrane protein YccF (DUF307 family)
VEDATKQVDSVIATGMDCVTVNIMWKILHSRQTAGLHLEWNVLQRTLCGRYFTASRERYFSWNGLCYSEQYVEDTSQQVDSDILAGMECVTLNIMWEILHGR